MRMIAAVFVTLLALGSGFALAQQPNVTGLAYDPVDLFESSAEDAEIVGSAGAGDFSFPAPILAVSDNGMIKVGVNGGEFWVIVDDVETDSETELQASCEPGMKGATVSFGARGLGEGCK